MNKLKWVQVPEGYRCPLCPDHDEEDFMVWETLLAEPLCHGCTFDIFQALLLIPPVDLLGPEKIPRLERLTGKPALELARLVVQEDIAELEKTESLEEKKQRYQAFPGVSGEEIEAQWQRRLAEMRTILAELTELARKKT